MAKPKGATGGSAAVGSRPAYSRVSFLFQAAALLATAPPTQSGEGRTKKGSHSAVAAPPSSSAPVETNNSPHLQGFSRRLLTQMRAVSRKTNMRLRPDVKRSVCKLCDTLLVEGDTCVSTVENQSRGQRKPWADILAVRCRTCGHVKRYPVAAPRPPRRPQRGEKRGEGEREGGD